MNFFGRAVADIGMKVDKEIVQTGSRALLFADNVKIRKVLSSLEHMLEVMLFDVDARICDAFRNKVPNYQPRKQPR